MEYRALLMEYRFFLIELKALFITERALMIAYRALLMKHRALLMECRVPGLRVKTLTSSNPFHTSCSTRCGYILSKEPNNSVKRTLYCIKRALYSIRVGYSDEF